MSELAETFPLDGFDPDKARERGRRPLAVDFVLRSVGSSTPEASAMRERYVDAGLEFANWPDITEQTESTPQLDK